MNINRTHTLKRYTIVSKYINDQTNENWEKLKREVEKEITRSEWEAIGNSNDWGLIR